MQRGATFYFACATKASQFPTGFLGTGVHIGQAISPPKTFGAANQPKCSSNVDAKLTTG